VITKTAKGNAHQAVCSRSVASSSQTGSPQYQPRGRRPQARCLPPGPGAGCQAKQPRQPLNDSRPRPWNGQKRAPQPAPGINLKADQGPPPKAQNRFEATIAGSDPGTSHMPEGSTSTTPSSTKAEQHRSEPGERIHCCSGGRQRQRSKRKPLGRASPETSSAVHRASKATPGRSRQILAQGPVHHPSARARCREIQDLQAANHLLSPCQPANKPPSPLSAVHPANMQPLAPGPASQPAARPPDQVQQRSKRQAVSVGKNRPASESLRL